MCSLHFNESSFSPCFNYFPPTLCLRKIKYNGSAIKAGTDSFRKCFSIPEQSLLLLTTNNTLMFKIHSFPWSLKGSLNNIIKAGLWESFSPAQHPQLHTKANLDHSEVEIWSQIKDFDSGAGRDAQGGRRVLGQELWR